ncbi:MAG: hypothetical protein V1708_02245, partial [Candidatus Micrarchaeota archaeon]
MPKFLSPKQRLEKSRQQIERAERESEKNPFVRPGENLPAFRRAGQIMHPDLFENPSSKDLKKFDTDSSGLSYNAFLPRVEQREFRNWDEVEAYKKKVVDAAWRVAGLRLVERTEQQRSPSKSWFSRA